MIAWLIWGLLLGGALRLIVAGIALYFSFPSLGRAESEAGYESMADAMKRGD